MIDSELPEIDETPICSDCGQEVDHDEFECMDGMRRVVKESKAKLQAAMAPNVSHTIRMTRADGEYGEIDFGGAHLVYRGNLRPDDAAKIFFEEFFKQFYAWRMDAEMAEKLKTLALKQPPFWKRVIDLIRF